MKLKILFAAGAVLIAACSQQENPVGQPSAQVPEPATTAATSTDMLALGTDKVEDPKLATQDYPSVELGSVLSAAAPAAALAPLLVSGWANPEPWGVWSDGAQARIGFKIDGAVDTDVEVTLQLKAFIGGSRNELTMVPTANGRQLAPIVFRGSQVNPAPHVLLIPSQDVAQANGRIQLDFAVQDPQSPQELGLSADPRKLGIGLVELSVR